MLVLVELLLVRHYALCVGLLEQAVDGLLRAGSAGVAICSSSAAESSTDIRSTSSAPSTSVSGSATAEASLSNRSSSSVSPSSITLRPVLPSHLPNYTECIEKTGRALALPFLLVAVCYATDIASRGRQCQPQEEHQDSHQHRAKHTGSGYSHGQQYQSQQSRTKQTNQKRV